MAWSIHRVSLAVHDLDASIQFFGTLLGLGEARRIDDRTACFGTGRRGLRLVRPSPALQHGADGALLGPAGARHLAIEVEHLEGVAARLRQRGLPCLPAMPGAFDLPALWTLDPGLNLVAFCQRDPGRPAEDPRSAIDPTWGWGLHHVNLEVRDVREATAFYVEVAGMAEGRWEAPPSRGSFSIDPSELAMLPSAGGGNRGLHVIRADTGFALRNGFAHNPSIGGHPAFVVPDVLAVKARLEAAGIAVSDAGVYAMVGMHQIYVHDPFANMIEVNQAV